MFYFTYHDTPLGTVLLTATDTALTGLYFKTQFNGLNTSAPQFRRQNDLSVFSKTKKWLDRYFARQNPDPDIIPLNPQGNTFRQRVWHLLRDIPYGELTTYGALAQKITEQTGCPMSAQAIGGAVGHNPISIIIPCHRVVSSNNNLTGYAGGIDIKISLLKTEGVDVSVLSLPHRHKKNNF